MKKDKEKLWSIIIAAIYGIAAVVFTFFIFSLGVLPTAYLAGLIVALAVVSGLLLWGLISKKKGKKQIVCGVIASILAILLIIGSAMVSDTLSFFNNIMAGGEQIHSYHVVVRADSPYEKVKDIEGQKVTVINAKKEVHKLAEEELEKKADVDFEVGGSYIDVANALIDEKTDIIYLSSAYYDMAIEELDGFTEDNTRILDTVNVRVKVERADKGVNVTKEPFNVYISGIDTTGSISNVSRSDVNMVMTVNPTTKEILLTSIPRDYYVMLPSYGAYDKLTHAGIYGVDESVAAAENLLGIEIPYYVKVNFTTVTSLVDALGGITIDSDYAFTSRDGYSYVEGENVVGGEEALSFARERKAFAAGDNQRVKNQQAVITGIIQKATGSTTILMKYNSILSAMTDKMETSLTKKDITSLVKMQLDDMSDWTFKRSSLKGSGSSATVYSMPSTTVYVMEPDQESVEKAKKAIHDTMTGGEEQ